jgi:WD40 repeat protein
MASALGLSKVGLEVVDQERRKKGWNKAEVAWQVQAEVSKSTLDRFWMQKPIKQQNFVAICLALGISDWQQVADLPPIASVPVRRGSNLGQVSEPVILELDGFAQRIFDWFKALEFDRESDPRREGNYVEWVIKVVMRSRVDRVLIRAIIHEAGLGDLDGLRRSVSDLRVDEGWLVTSLWVSPSVKQVLNKSQEGLICLTFDELIDQDANFAPYVAWLEAEVRRRELEKYYVPLGCTKGEFDGGTKTLRAVSSYPVSEGGIDLYIDRWLENPMNEHVSILGEFGTGKTWFVLHYAGRCLRAYLEAKQKGLPRPRLPLVIPLRDYAKALNVENVLAGFFYTQHNIRLNSAVFDRLNQMGKLLLIFDGFDEMADKVDHQKMIDNFWELAKVVTPNAKVILTCRTEHFPTAQVGRDTLRGELLASTARLTGVPPQFETLELMKFDDVQIREVLGRRTNEVTVEKVMGNGQVLDLLRRAVMAEFVLAALPEIEAGAEIDLARVYLYAVRRQMEENITTGRTFTSLADKLYFLCELSWEMLSTDRMSLNYREFPDLLRRSFGAEVESQKDLDHWHYDMMGQTMLVRNDDGDYSPAHRSLLEFFVAYKFAAELGLLHKDFWGLMVGMGTGDARTWSEYCEILACPEERERFKNGEFAGFRRVSEERLVTTFGKMLLTKVVIDLLLPLLNIKVKYRQSNILLELMQWTCHKNQPVGWLGTNAGQLLVNQSLYGLEYQNLAGAMLPNINLRGVGLREVDLTGANLSDALLTMTVSECNVIVVSPNNKWFATGHDDFTIRIWDASSGRELLTLRGHQGSITAMVVSNDGQWLFSGSYDGTVRRWNTLTSEYLSSYNHQDIITAIAVSADGYWLFSGGFDNTVKKWNTLTGEQLILFNIYQDDVKYLSQNTMSNRGESSEFLNKFVNISYNVKSLRALVVSLDGCWLFSSCGDGTVKKWDGLTGEFLLSFDGHQNEVRTLALSADEQSLFSGCDDGIIKKWDVENGEHLLSLDVCKLGISSIVVSVDGRWLFSSSNDGIVKKWDLETVEEITSFNCNSPIAISHDGNWLFSSYATNISKWNSITSECEFSFNGYLGWVNEIAISTNNRWLFSRSNNVMKKWDVLTEECLLSIQCDRSFIIIGGEHHFFSLSKDKIMEKRDALTGEYLLSFDGYQDQLIVTVVSADERWLFSGGKDKTVKKWDTFTGEYLFSFDGHQDWVTVLSVSLDGCWLFSGDRSGMVKKWDLETGECLFSLEDHNRGVESITLNRNSRWLFSVDGNRTVRKWDVETGECILSLDDRENILEVIAVDSDGRWLFSGGNTGRVKVWDCLTGKFVRSFGHHQRWITSLCLDDNNKWLFSSSSDHTVKKWDIETGECIAVFNNSLCANAKIQRIQGLSDAQRESLIALGAMT